ncbi:hypothetical protein EG328_006136 [Venturia inaequalis]|uniref:Transmembrane protein n=1 Tax=Venturia inaequalis TaxID=5025 RepID=A0A8H3UH95_VENIN|nr:hypothetical protein EG328_006136 [Venturia inaequalis]
MPFPPKPNDTGILYDVNLRDEKTETRKAKGYHGWEAGAPHDPNHQAPFEYIPNMPHWRRRITASLWYMVALHGCLALLAMAIIVLITVFTAKVDSAASRTESGIPISFNASENVVPVITVISMVNGSSFTFEELATRIVETTTTSSASAAVVTKQLDATKVAFYTPPPTTITTAVRAKRN